MFMLWGRLAYNPATSDSVFRNYLALKYPEAAAENLFAAWSKASRGLPRVTELVHGTLKLDFHWWPEGCQSQKGFVTAAEFADAIPGKGSTLCSIAQSASNGCAGGKSSLALADEIEGDALGALSLVHPMSAPPNTELRVALDTIKAMSYLTIHYAHMIRGATYLKAGAGEKARNALGAAYWWWLVYSDLMDKMYTGMNIARSADFPHWRYHDNAVLKDYTSNGGVGIPDRPRVTNPAVEFPRR
jgi:hypothetical protein